MKKVVAVDQSQIKTWSDLREAFLLTCDADRESCRRLFDTLVTKGFEKKPLTEFPSLSCLDEINQALAKKDSGLENSAKLMSRILSDSSISQSDRRLILSYIAAFRKLPPPIIPTAEDSTLASVIDKITERSFTLLPHQFRTLDQHPAPFATRVSPFEDLRNGGNLRYESSGQPMIIQWNKLAALLS